MQFRPMKGEKVTDDQLHLLKYPFYVSLKLDGIRCLVKDGKALTAALKPLPNRFVREYLEQPRFEGFDGELLLRSKNPHAKIDLQTPFNEISSAFMSRDGEPDFVFHVFDLHNQGAAPFVDRMHALAGMPLCGRTHVIPHVLCYDEARFRRLEETAILAGFEGVMLRQPDLPYKFGKASIKQGHLLKRKPMSEMEAIIVGFEEGEENQNPATLNERGLTTRSSAKDGKIPNGTLGKLLVRNSRFGDFKIGTGKGLDHALRAIIWANQDQYLGQIIQFSFQEMGTIDKPRIPIFQRFRDPKDLEPELIAELRGLL